MVISLDLHDIIIALALLQFGNSIQVFITEQLLCCHLLVRIKNFVSDMITLLWPQNTTLLTRQLEIQQRLNSD